MDAIEGHGRIGARVVTDERETTLTPDAGGDPDEAITVKLTHDGPLPRIGVAVLRGRVQIGNTYTVGHDPGPTEDDIDW